MASVLLGSRRKETSTPVEVEPHRWALSLWARSFRRLGRPWVLTRHARRFCAPLELDGAEHLLQASPPALIIANHTSHFDTLIALSLLPDHLFRRTAVAAAADRFYRSTLKGAWFSLRYNAFPITRGGGRAALTYSEWLLQNGWALLIFPEGTRSRTGELQPFHPGPAILAVRQSVPVVPMYIEGAAGILPPGTKWAQPAPVRVRVGPAVSFGPHEDIGEAMRRMEAAMRDLALRWPVEAAS